MQNYLAQQGPEAKMKMEALKNERSFREATAAAGGDMTKIAGAAMQFGKPEVAAGIYKAQEDRLARVQTAHDALENRKVQMEQTHALNLQRITDATQRTAETARHNQAMETLGAQSRGLQAEIARGNQELKKLGLELQAEKIRIDREKLGQGKVLPSPLQKQLTEAAELTDATTRFKTTFKDEYGGKTVTGELGNVAGRIFGDESGQSQWWQDYELHQSQVRNKLFGSALTAPEIEAWNKSAINPRMEAKQIKENLARRFKLENTGLERLMKGAAAGGYKKEQIEAFTGREVSGVGPALKPAPVNPPPKAVDWKDLK